MPSTTYVAHRPGPFSALVQAPEIGGLRLHPLPPARVRDRFFDTPTGTLLGRGLALRVREQDGRWTAALRSLPGASTGDGLPPDVDLKPGGGTRLDLPAGPLVDVVRPLVGDDPLEPVVTLRQYRTPRVCLDGARPVGLLSLDVVVYEVPGADVVLNEAELETTDAASEADRQRIDAALRHHGLELARLSKVEGAFLRVPRTLAQAALLLPAERAALEAAARTGPPMLQRRARVVLLDARGLRPDTIAAQTGLSMSRVRHWRLQFRERRLGILELEPQVSTSTPVAWPAGSADAPVPTSAPVAEARAGAPDDAPPVLNVPEAPPPSGPFAEEPVNGVPEVPVDVGAVPSPVEADPPDVGVPPAEPDLPADPDPRAEPVPSPPEGQGTTPRPADRAGGDGQAPPPTEAVEDMADLLDLFRPSETATPLLDEEPWGDEDVRPSPPVPPASVVRPMPRPAFPVVLGPVSGPQGPSTSTAPPLRRPRLTGDTPLVEAARATLAYHVAAFEAAARRFVRTRSLLDARRLLIAAHRVRLAADAFRPVLPERAAARLVSALRPLVHDLDEAIDLGRAAETYDGTLVALGVHYAAAIERVAARLGDGHRQPWGDRARRLLARLEAQQGADLVVGDDFPEPPDDFIGAPGDAPQPSRLRHMLASLLWTRYEAIRAFEGSLDGDVAEDTAYHLAVAISGLHFAVGLAAGASAGPVREVSDALDAAEGRVMAVRNARAHAKRVARAGGTPGPRPEVGSVRQAWASLADAAFRHRLASVSAGV